MKIISYHYPKSSFLSIDKDANIITNMIFQNDNLKKMLYYNTRDCLNKPNLTEDQSLDMFGKHIKLVPKIYIDDEMLNYLIIQFDNFFPTENPEFRDNIIEFDILCHYSQWQMKDFQLRPYRIAAEIDSMFCDKHLTGVGKLEFVSAGQIIMTDEFGGLCLKYRAIHGEEDKKHMPNPEDEEQFIENFNKIFNK